VTCPGLWTSGRMRRTRVWILDWSLPWSDSQQQLVVNKPGAGQQVRSPYSLRGVRHGCPRWPATGEGPSTGGRSCLASCQFAPFGVTESGMSCASVGRGASTPLCGDRWVGPDLGPKNGSHAGPVHHRPRPDDAWLRAACQQHAVQPVPHAGLCQSRSRRPRSCPTRSPALAAHRGRRDLGASEHRDSDHGGEGAARKRARPPTR
jgi:hypothetical protein